MKRLIYFLILLIGLVTVGFLDPYASRIRPFTSVPVSCAENSVGYSMTLHKFYICTNTGYKEVDIGGAGSFAPVDATYITQTANANLTNEQALSALATGILKNTTTTGVLSIAVASDLPSGITYSQLTLTNSIVSGDIVSLVWSKITGTPTTISGYGITDFNSLGDARWSLLAHTHTFASLTSKPTTLSGYGITDALNLSGGTLTGNLLFTDNTLDIGASGATRPRTGYFGTSLISPLFNGLAITNNGTNTLNITAGKTLIILKSISFTAADDTGVYTLPTGTKTLIDSTVATLSSLSSIGTITTGVWNGTIINSTYGGTGINNAGRTLTLNTNSGTIAFSATSKVITFGNTLTFNGTDSTVMTFPTTSATIARIDAANSFTGIQTFNTSINLVGLLFSSTAPTISSGFGASPSIVASNGTAAFTVNVGTGGTASDGTIAMPTATTGWICHVENITATNSNRASQRTVQVGTATDTGLVIVQNQSLATGVALAWTASDKLVYQCTAY